MGQKKIEAKRKELSQLSDTLEKLLGVVEKLGPSLQKVQDMGRDMEARFENLEKKKRELLPTIEKIDTRGVKEFEHYKRHLTEICSNRTFGTRVLPVAPLKAVVEKQKKEVSVMMADWLKSLAGNMPKELKKGMVLHDYAIDRIIELTSDASDGLNANLKGDAAIFYDATFFTVTKDNSPAKKIGSITISKADLLKGGKVKYLKM